MSSDGGQEGEFFALAGALRAFRAGPLGDDPSDRALARAAGVSPTTVGDWLRGERFPQDIGKVLAVVGMVRAAAAARGIAISAGGPPGLLDEKCWREAYRAEARRRADAVSSAVQGAQAARALALPAGRPLAEVTDPFALEVHRPVQPEDPPPELPELPAYLPREHDQLLAQVVRAAVAGRSGIAVLVGGSSTGKTRACWEALQPLRDQLGPWRLWHPIDPTCPDAALRELSGIGPWTVVWLNEAQFYLDPPDGALGERVAAGLRELLRDPARAPVLVLATLWPQFWDTLTARPADGPDRHAQARELLAGHDITVPAAFTPAQLNQLSRVADARLALAAAGAQDGQVIQFLAGAPELLARYRNAPPAAKALVNAAMDARRLGAGIGLPRAFLETAAPGYLTDADWDGLGEDWLDQALAYTVVPCKGVRGPLTPIRPRPGQTRSLDGDDQPSAGHAGFTGGGSLYRIADYLDQHGRAYRKDQIPPAGFWAAAADHALPADQAALGYAAVARGLYRAAIQLHKNAAAAGNPRAAYYLIDPPPCLHGDGRPVSWAVAHVALDDPSDVVELLRALREAGAHEQTATLLDRDPAAHVALNDPHGVAMLLGRLLQAGAREQTATLLDRDPAAHVALDDSHGVGILLEGLLRAGAREQAAALADRAAAHVPGGVAARLQRLLDGPEERFAKLTPPGAGTWLEMVRRSAAEGATVLLYRDPAAHVALDKPRIVAGMLGRLREAGAHEQAAALLDRDPAAHVLLDDPGGVAELLDSLRAAGAHEQAAALADRAAAHVPFDTPDGVRFIAPGVAELLRALREAGAHEQAAALVSRLPAAGLFGFFLEQHGRADQFRFGREADGSPSAPWGWEDLDLWPAPLSRRS